MYKLAIVDDEPLVRKGILKKLENFEPALEFAGEADNGEYALELARTEQPDIIITDMRMPVMDGKTLLKVLQLEFPLIKIIVISGHTDFEYMQQAIAAKVVGYLLKPFNREEIHDALSKAVALLDGEKSLKHSIETMKKQNMEISVRSDRQLMASTILGINQQTLDKNEFSEKLNELVEKNWFVLATAYSQMKLDPQRASEIAHAVSASNKVCIFVPHIQQEQVGFFLLFTPKNVQADVRSFSVQRFGELLDLYGGDSSIPVLAGFSGVKSSLSELHHAFKETIHALDSRQISCTDSYYLFSEYTGNPSPVKWDKTDELVFFLESGNKQKVSEMITDFFDYCERGSSVALISVKQYCRSLVNEVRNILLTYFGNMSIPAFSTSYEAIVDYLFDIISIRNYMTQMLSGISEMMKEKNVYSSSNTIDNMKLYIQNNYHKNLSLEKVSQLFFFNPSYCSFLFKEKTGVNFTDYVNRVRIEKAKNLLKNTNERIMKISKNLGFNNVKYFFKVFKKFTGTTPDSYRSKDMKA